MIGVYYTHPDGRKEPPIRKRSPIQTRRGAEQYEREVRAALAAGTYRREEPQEIPVLNDFKDEFISNFAKVYNRPSEVKSKEGAFRRYLLPELGRLRLDEIHVRQIEALKAKMLAEGKSAKTINNACAGVLGKCLRWAHELELIESVPKIRKLKVEPAKWDFLDFSEANRLLEAAKKTPEWYAMIYFDLRTGLRFGELSELRWDDVDLVAGKLLVRRSYHDGHVGPPKNGESREIPLSAETVEFLKEHRRRQRQAKAGVVVKLVDASVMESGGVSEEELVEDDAENGGRESQETGKAPQSELVFSQPNGKRHIHRRADVGLKRCCTRAKLRMIGWHCLRHTFASHLVMRGASLKAVQELLGHATMEMTLRYSHLSPQVRKDAVELLDARREIVQQHRDSTSVVMDR